MGFPSYTKFEPCENYYVKQTSETNQEINQTQHNNPQKNQYPT